ncbi:hypothetical protein PG993_007956 [Apiospora rasikravindrae]|uniref:Uncharacterized protein n=1 Tax=Apiospora rasikravindrae TaxID=990691 RepID=A0ABR1T0R4_9PEZI
MFRMANETKYCTECQARHPLIMFSHKQREVESGAICIMAEGGVAICPHHTVSLRQLREWRYVIRSDKHQTPPWLLRCDLCFQELDEPLRSSAVQPSATCLLPEVIKLPDRLEGTATQGALCVQWTMPLGIKAKAAVAAGATTLLYNRRERDSHGAEKIEEALSRASEAGYNSLLCPHISFDDLRVFHAFAGIAYEVVYDFKKGHVWQSELDPTEGFVQRSNNPHVSTSSWLDGPCRVCSPIMSGFRPYLDEPQRYEYLWIVGKRGLSLQRQLKLPVPDLSAPWSDLHDVWLQMLDPTSYGLTTDKDLQHITWCPDNRCANGRSWATHQKHLDIITEHFKARLSMPLPSYSRIGCFLPVFGYGYEKNNFVEQKHQPHTYRGLRFLPIPKPEWMRYLPDP